MIFIGFIFISFGALLGYAAFRGLSVPCLLTNAFNPKKPNASCSLK